MLVAFHRANPKFEEDGSAPEPLPACLESLMTKNILVNAKRDGIQKMKNFIEKDRVVLNKIRKYRDPSSR